MYFKIEDDDLLEKYNTIWDKVSADIKKKIGGPVYNKKYLKTKIKFHGDEVMIVVIDSTDACLAVMSLDFALKKDGNYFPQVCKFIEEKVIRHINENLS